MEVVTRSDLNLAKKIHRYSHEIELQMMNFPRD